MSFLSPLSLLFSLLAGPIILLYMLRLRRRETLVSSTLLWSQLLRDREANAPWQKLRRNLLLILQLIILAALVFALARPFFPVSSVVSGSVVVLLDASASMQATDVQPSRFAAAQAQVSEIIGDLSGDSQMTLIQVGQTPVVLASATSDKSSLLQALATAQPDTAPADWNAAFALAIGAVQGFQSAKIVLVSDGGVPTAELPPITAELIYVPIGTSSANLAISALATRKTEAGPQLFASVTNYGLAEQTALLTIARDGVLFDSKRIVVPANAASTLTWDLPEDTAVVTAKLSENSNDFLALDDTAWAVHEGGVSNRVLLITDGNLFLEQIYAVLPGIEVFKSAPDSPNIAESIAKDEFDMYVFDGVPLPEPPPAADMLIINPQPGSTLFTVNGVFSDTVAIRLANSPLLQFVDWRTVHIKQAQSVEAPWAQTLVQGEGGPLILTGERNGRRVAFITFDLGNSDLPVQIAYPILMANITSWLTPGRAFEAATTLKPGDPVKVSPGASTTAVAITRPDTSVWEQAVGEEDIIYTETTQPGLYTIRLRDAQGERDAGSFAINLFSPTESNLTPVPDLQIGLAETPSTAEGNVGQRELWTWLAFIAVLVLLAEWWVHHRGTQLPVIKFK